MCHVCITENGTVVGIEGGHIKISVREKDTEYIPKELVQSIAIYGNSQLTSSCIRFCLENGLNVSFFSSAGTFYGRLAPICNTNIVRQKQQIKLFERDEYAIPLAKNIIHAKINNQYVVVKRYFKRDLFEREQLFFKIRNARRNVINATTANQIMGYEGIAARSYFNIIACGIKEDFCFERRCKRYAKDPFNSMLSFGYSILNKEIHGILESTGLNSYQGFLHTDRNNHPALASDMIEEWRPVIVDSTVLSLIQGNEIDKDMFIYEDDDYCKMSSELIKKLILKLEQKMSTEMNYLEYIHKPVTFRSALWHQADKLVKAIEKGRPELYMPIQIR